MLEEQLVKTAAEMARLNIKTRENYNCNKADQLKERLRELAGRARGSDTAVMEKEEASSKEAIKRSSTSEAIAALRRGNLNAPSLSGN